MCHLNLSNEFSCENLCFKGSNDLDGVSHVYICGFMVQHDISASDHVLSDGPLLCREFLTNLKFGAQ